MLAHAHKDAYAVTTALRMNKLLRLLDDKAFQELMPQLEIVDLNKGQALEHQGDEAMEQYFIVSGILKRVVNNAEGKEMILRFATEGDIDTSYAAYRLGTPIPFSIVSVKQAQVAKISMEAWVAFIDKHAKLKQAFELHVMRIMSDVMAHVITLHLLDSPGRVTRFMRKTGNLINRIPKRELASHLNITPETLSRLKQRGVL
ncbi:MAG: hypothetical protein RLZZ502_538 [Pseudomonadota bacterium]|jgi:CRP-like cAMP-binding protein